MVIDRNEIAAELEKEIEKLAEGGTEALFRELKRNEFSMHLDLKTRDSSTSYRSVCRNVLLRDKIRGQPLQDRADFFSMLAEQYCRAVEEERHNTMAILEKEIKDYQARFLIDDIELSRMNIDYQTCAKLARVE